MKPFLFGQDFWKYIDGSSTPPDQVLPSTEGQPPKSNPEYQSWFRTDQMLISLLRATLSEPILGLVVGLTTSRTIWETLQAHFSQQSVANASQLRSNLLYLSRDNRTISEYLLYAKSLADSLAAIGQPVLNDELVQAILRGLGPGYEMIVTATLHFPPLPSFQDLRARLLSFEAQHSTASPTPPTALLAQQYAGTQSGHGHGHTNIGHHNTSGNRGGYHRNRNRNRGRHNNGRHSSSFHSGFLAGSPSFCQLCNGAGHLASQCPRLSAFAGLHMSPQSQPHNSNAHAFAGFQQYQPPLPFAQHSLQPSQPPSYMPYQPAVAHDPNGTQTLVRLIT
ncbi:hypothetical protein ACE6H2_020001 [Prunus campanulata]